jgi:hypothetical protein
MATISIYEIEAAVDDTDWVDAWAVVENSYGIDAICRNVFESDVSVNDEVIALKEVSKMQSKLSNLLSHEYECGATHAFVHSKVGSAVFGVNLKHIFG